MASSTRSRNASRSRSSKPAAPPAVEPTAQAEPSAPPAAKPAADTLATKPKPTPNTSLNGIAIEWGMIVQQNESIGGGITGLVMLVEDGVVIYRTIVAGSADYGVGKLDAMPAEELVAFELPPELRIVTTAARALTGARTHAIGRDGEKIQVGDIITDDAVTGVVTAAEDEAVIYRPLDDAQGNRFDPARRISANAHECRLVYRPEPAVSAPANDAADEDEDPGFEARGCVGPGLPFLVDSVRRFKVSASDIISLMESGDIDHPDEVLEQELIPELQKARERVQVLLDVVWQCDSR